MGFFCGCNSSWCVVGGFGCQDRLCHCQTAGIMWCSTVIKGKWDYRGNGVYSLFDRFTDPHRIEFRSGAMKVIICRVNYLGLETTCFDNPQFPSPSLIYLRTTFLSLALLAWLSISASLPSRADIRNRDMSLQRHQVPFHHPIFALFFSCAVVCEADYF